FPLAIPLLPSSTPVDRVCDVLSRRDLRRSQSDGDCHPQAVVPLRQFSQQSFHWTSPVLSATLAGQPALRLQFDCEEFFDRAWLNQLPKALEWEIYLPL